MATGKPVPKCPACGGTPGCDCTCRRVHTQSAASNDDRASARAGSGAHAELYHAIADAIERGDHSQRRPT